MVASISVVHATPVGEDSPSQDDHVVINIPIEAAEAVRVSPSAPIAFVEGECSANDRGGLIADLPLASSTSLRLLTDTGSGHHIMSETCEESKNFVGWLFETILQSTSLSLSESKSIFYHLR